MSDLISRSDLLARIEAATGPAAMEKAWQAYKATLEGPRPALYRSLAAWIKAERAGTLDPDPPREPQYRKGDAR